jgi:hypothetical protein
MAQITLEQITFLYLAIGVAIWIFAALKSYDELDVIGMVLGLFLCVLFWPFLIITALIKITFDR